MERLIRESMAACRRLRTSLVFAVFATISLSAGLGITIAAYSVVDAVLWRPSGIADESQVVGIANPGRRGPVMSWTEFQILRDQQTAFSSVTASATFYRVLVVQQHAETIAAEAVSCGYFTTFGIRVRLGRGIACADKRASDGPVAVISERLWRQTFAGDPRVIGKTVRLSGHAYTVVGVVDESFRGLDRYQPTDAWVPITGAPTLKNGTPLVSAENRDQPVLVVHGRLGQGVARETAAAQIATIRKRLLAASGTPVQADRSNEWSIASARPASIVSDAGVALIAVIVVVLLIACSNIANLSLARGAARRGDFAIRKALGATRWDLVREQLLESAMIAGISALAGLAFARVLLARVPIDLPLGQGVRVTLDPHVTGSAYAAGGVALVLSLLVFGVWPSVRLTRVELASASATRRWKSQRRLIASQVGASVLLLMVAGLCVEALVSEHRRGTGIDLAHLALVQVDFGGTTRSEPSRRSIVRRALEQATRQDVFDAVAASVGLPFGLPGPRLYVTTPERPFGSRPSDGPMRVYSVSTTPNLFRVLRVPLVDGRPLTDRDDANAPRVAILSESLARELFQRTSIVGSTIVFCRRSRPTDSDPVTRATVIGVAADTDVGRVTKRGHLLYLPLAQDDIVSMNRIVFSGRSRVDTRIGVSAMLQDVRGADPALALVSAGSGRVVLAGPYYLLTLLGQGALALGLMAILLAATGLYGILAHAVALRRREFGIRVALGASRPRIVYLVLREGVHPILTGIAIGSLLGTAGRLAFQPLFSQRIDPVDPFVLAPVAILLLIAGLVASGVPALRAANVEPSRVLHNR